MQRLAARSLGIVLAAASACTSAHTSGPDSGTSGGSGLTSSTGSNSSTGGTSGRAKESETGTASTGTLDGCSPTIHNRSAAIGSDDDLEMLRGVTEIEGDVVIEGTVTTLEPLNCLRHVGGSLEIRNTELSTLTGLQQLVSANEVEVHGNDNLESFASFGIVDVEGLFWIYDNPNLEAIELELVEYIGGLVIGRCSGSNPVEFSGNETLTEINFPALSDGQIPSISVAGNASLISADGILERSASIVLLDLQGNEMLNGEAIRNAWLASGKDAETISTCGNLGDANACTCAGTE